MSEMVERVARALQDTLLKHGIHSDQFNSDEAARTAIEAMREPTEAMVHARWQTTSRVNPACWKAMIDAALSG